MLQLNILYGTFSSVTANLSASGFQPNGLTRGLCNLLMLQLVAPGFDLEVAPLGYRMCRLWSIPPVTEMVKTHQARAAQMLCSQATAVMVKPEYSTAKNTAKISRLVICSQPVPQIHQDLKAI